MTYAEVASAAMSAEVEQTAWPELRIVCPHCGNHGEPEGEWQVNAWTPFKLIEEVVRSWEFAGRQDGSVLRLTADASSDTTDWEGGTNLRIECMQCFGSFAVPEGAEVAFE